MKTAAHRKPLALLFMLPTLVGFSSATATDVVYEKPPLGVTDEFRFLGNALACISDKPNPVLGYERCLHIGPVYLDAESHDLETILGEPYEVARRSSDTETRVYALQGTGPILPYFAIDVREGRVVAIQLTGDDKTEYSFAGVSLRDRKKTVEKMLGPPSYKKEVAEVEAVLWSYNPFPISIEVKNSRVYSIRIYQP